MYQNLRVFKKINIMKKLTSLQFSLCIFVGFFSHNGVVGVESELGSRAVGLDGVGDTGVSTFGDISGDCTSEKKG